MKSKYFKDLNESIKYDSKFVNGPVHAAWFINHVSSFVAMIDEVLADHYSNGSMMSETKITYTDQALNEQSNDHRSIKKIFNQKILPNIYFSAFMALKKVSSDSLSLNEIAKALGTKGNVTNPQGMFRILTENNKTLIGTNNIMHSFYAHPMRTNRDEYLIIHEDVTVFDPKTGYSISYPVFRTEVLKFILLQVAGDVELETRLTSAFKPINEVTFGKREFELHKGEVGTLAKLFPGKTADYIKDDEFYFPYIDEAKKTMKLDDDTKKNEFFVCLDLQLHKELDRFGLKKLNAANGVMLPMSSAKKLFPEQNFPIMPQIITNDSASYLNCFDIIVDNVKVEQTVGNEESVESTNTTIRMELNHERAKEEGIKLKIKPVTLIRGLDRLDKKYHLLFKSQFNFELPVITSLMANSNGDAKKRSLDKSLSELIETRAELDSNAFKASSMIPNYFGDIGFKNSGIINSVDATLFDVNEAYKEIDITSLKDGGKLLGYMSAIFNNDPSSNNGRSTMHKANMRLLEENAVAAIIQDIMVYTKNGPIELNVKRSRFITKKNFNQIESEIIVPTQLSKTVYDNLSLKVQQYANWTSDIVTEDAVFLPLGITEVTSDGNGFVKAVTIDSKIKVKHKLQDTISTKDVQDKELSFELGDNIQLAVENYMTGKTFIGRTFTPKSTIMLSDIYTGIKSELKFQQGDLEYHNLELFKQTEMEADSNFYESDTDSVVLVNTLQFNKVRKDIREFTQENSLNYRVIKNNEKKNITTEFDTATLIKQLANEAVIMNGVNFTSDQITLDVEVINLEANIFGAINVVAAKGNILTLIRDFHYLFLKQTEIDLIANMRHTNRIVFKPDAVLAFLKTTAENIQTKFDLLYGADSDIISKLLNDTDLMVTQNYLTKALIKALNDELAEYNTMDKIYILSKLQEMSDDKTIDTDGKNGNDGTGPDSNISDAESDSTNANKRVMGTDPLADTIDANLTAKTKNEDVEDNGLLDDKQSPITNINPKVEDEIEKIIESDELEENDEASKEAQQELLEFIDEETTPDAKEKSKSKGKGKTNGKNNK